MDNRISAAIAAVLDAVAKLIEALAKSAALVTWPLVVVFVLFLFAPEIRKLSERLEGQQKLPGGFELKLAAASNIAAASIEQSLKAASPQKPITSADLQRTIATSFQDIERLSAATNTSTKNLLWVDDNPRNNELERKSFEQMGFVVTLALSTDEALRLTERRNFQLIISDMTRGENTQAGYELLTALRGRNNSTPVIFYRSASSPQTRAKAIEQGAVGETNSPIELLALSARALGLPPRGSS